MHAPEQLPRLRHLAAILFLLLPVMPPAAGASDMQLDSVGFRASTSFRGEDITQGDLFVAHRLPWSWTFSPGWDIATRAELALSDLHQENDDGLSASMSTDLVLSTPLPRVTFNTGVGAGVLEDSVIGDHDLGGPIFFLFHAGAALRLTPILSLGYRYGHQSNGHIYSRNPSLNLHQLELRFSF